MIKVTEIWDEGFGRVIRGLHSALSSTGHDADGPRLVRNQAALLAEAVVSALPPKDQERGKKKIRRDVVKILAVMKPNIPKDHSRSRVADFSWVVVGPKFVIGVSRDDDRRGDGGIIYQFMKARQNGERKNKLVAIGHRGKQTVYKLNRLLVNKSQFDLVVRYLALRLGEMRASLAKTAATLGGKVFPGWISRHFNGTDRARRKSVLDETGLAASGDPHVTFGSRAPGIVRQTEAFRKGVKFRKHMMEADALRLLRGYREDILAGREPRRRE